MSVLTLAMRITEQAKEEVRRRILDEAQRLYRSGDPARISTRELASAAGIAHGTLFNYFPTKEALLFALVRECLEGARAALRARSKAPTLDEELFAWIAAELAALATQRALFATAFGSTILPGVAGDGVATEFRAETLALITELIERHAPAPSVAALHLAWTLYLGVLGFWVRDSSPNNEDTLSVLDETTRLVSALVLNKRGGEGA